MAAHTGTFLKLAGGLFGADAEFVEHVAEDHTKGGELVVSGAVRDAVEAQAGSGAGARVSLVCRGAQGAGPVAYEVRLSLPPVVQLRAPAPSLPRALSAGPAVPPVRPAHRPGSRPLAPRP